MIEIKNLTFHYKKGKPILNDMTTTLSPGHIYGLLGLNGEGKTTLLKLIAGLIFPKTGNILVGGIPTAHRSSRFFAQIYMLPDHPVAPNLKIKEFICIYSPFYKNFSIDFFNTALKELNVDATERIKSLSFGQQKKFHLAFALATNTKFLLLDEPTNGLDIPSKSIVRKLLAKTITEEKTIIISTHLVKDIENLIDHLLIFKEGHLTMDLHLLDILKRYIFLQSAVPLDGTLYTEQYISTYHHILPNTQQTESNLNIELLFNAVQQAKI